MKKVWNPRPQPQGDRTAEQLAQHGVACLSVPILTIIPLGDVMMQNTSDVIIFVSPSAVIHCHAKSITDDTVIVAMGPGTKAACRQHGMNHVLMPQTFSSEGVAQMSLWSEKHIHTAMIVCGEKHNDQLAGLLGRQSIQCEKFVCYRSVENVISPEEKAIIADQCNMIICTSRYILHLINRAFESNDIKNTHQLIVISREAQAFAESDGWSNVVLTTPDNIERLIVSKQRECQ